MVPPAPEDPGAGRGWSDWRVAIDAAVGDPGTWLIAAFAPDKADAQRGAASLRAAIRRRDMTEYRFETKVRPRGAGQRHGVFVRAMRATHADD